VHHDDRGGEGCAECGEERETWGKVFEGVLCKKIKVD
jgi:hypothetical protein